jgi:putative toxin-antitoxin system antitoxin component (TIGR02293 family)
VSLIGGDHMFSPVVGSSLDAHLAILKGFSNRALTHLVGNVAVMQQVDVMERVVGISLRTVQRLKKKGATKPLSQEQSGGIWKFAEVLARATRVLGSQEEAEVWLSRMVIGLCQRRPIDLLATTAGVEIVEDQHERLEYGVCA